MALLRGFNAETAQGIVGIVAKWGNAALGKLDPVTGVRKCIRVAGFPSCQEDRNLDFYLKSLSFLSFFLFFFLDAACSSLLQDLSSLTRDGTGAAAAKA